jgi:hypothetical protein
MPATAEATITCPHCRSEHRERMPQNACQVAYVCSRCGHELKPKHGDCCVFCSYAEVPCPPKARALAEPLR